ncbi:hypothetical protein LCGC14_0420260 [marine sediment metagenome]|uniref:Uncharacterized protein n=1 Tax=marine sediment metagenome TaxID=412755 RepID=A0A0F9T8Y0_9ZZZZ
MKIAIFRWKDASLHGQTNKYYDDLQDLDLVTLISSGLVIKQDDSQITLCMDWYAGEVSYRSCQTYPKSCIEIIKYIEIPKTVIGKWSLT